MPVVSMFLAQVYVHYQPLAKRQPEEARNSCEKGLPMSDACREPGVMVRERLCITCRLVKDFQQEIQLVARLAHVDILSPVLGNLETSRGGKIVAFRTRFRFLIREKNSMFRKGLSCCITSLRAEFIVGGVLLSLPDRKSVCTIMLIIDTQYVPRSEKTQSNVSCLGTNLL